MTKWNYRCDEVNLTYDQMLELKKAGLLNLSIEASIEKQIEKLYDESCLKNTTPKYSFTRKHWVALGILGLSGYFSVTDDSPWWFFGLVAALIIIFYKQDITEKIIELGMNDEEFFEKVKEIEGWKFSIEEGNEKEFLVHIDKKDDEDENVNIDEDKEEYLDRDDYEEEEEEEEEQEEDHDEMTQDTHLLGKWLDKRVNDYGTYMVDNHTSVDIVDSSELPHPKEEILDAIIASVILDQDGESIGELSYAALELAFHQENVGPKRLSLLGVSSSEFMELSKSMVAKVNIDPEKIEKEGFSEKETDLIMEHAKKTAPTEDGEKKYEEFKVLVDKETQTISEKLELATKLRESSDEEKLKGISALTNIPKYIRSEKHMTKDNSELIEDDKEYMSNEKNDSSKDIAIVLIQVLGSFSNWSGGTLLFIMYLYQNYIFEGSSFFSLRFWGLLFLGEIILILSLHVLTFIFSFLISFITETLIPLLFKKIKQVKTIRTYTLTLLMLSSICILIFITWKFSYYSFAYTYGNISLKEILKVSINNQEVKTFPNGSTFVGDLKDGHMWNGEYRYNSYDGTSVTELKDGNIWNGSGTQTYPNGDKYRGEFKEGELTGQVKIMHSNGDIYEGGFKDGRKNGLGRIFYINGDTYKGGYKNGRHHGQGKYSYSNGDVHEGQYKDGQAHGRGEYTFSNGNKYVGEFNKDKLEGEGIMYFSDGGKAVGEFKNSDIWNGQIYNKNGKLFLDVVKGTKLKRNPSEI